MKKARPDICPRNANAKERILHYVFLIPESTCWFWNGYHDRDGYAKMSYENYPSRACRVSYLEFVGEIPEGLVVDHLCRERGCVNPKHLECVTVAENTRRGLQGKLRPVKILCRRGHEYTEANKYFPPGLSRYTCATCQQLNNRSRKNPNKARDLRVAARRVEVLNGER